MTYRTNGTYSPFVTALRGVPILREQVFPVVRSSRATLWPCCVYTPVGGDVVGAVEGHATSWLMQLDVYSKGFGEMFETYRQIEAALERAGLVAGTPGSPTVLYEPDLETGVYRLTVELSVVGHAV